MKKIIFALFFGNWLFAQTQQPNILWIVCEDISPTLSFYGDKTAKTPNLDALADESLIFDAAFATTPVCGPSRSAIITGMMPSSLGTMHMRTGKDVQSWGKLVYSDTVHDHRGNLVNDLSGKPIREYAAVIPEQVKCFTEYLRAANYYCTNNQKTDYQFAAPQSAWDENNGKAHWRNTPKGMPFFSVFNFGETHESKIWENQKLPLTVAPETVVLPPYFPDTEVVRRDVARHYSNIELLDKQVGLLIEQLKKDGLYDTTIIFFYSDHGGPLPRQKREIYDSGLRVPLMVRFPKAETKGRSSQLVSFADLAPTVLSLAQIKAPKYMEGVAFLGTYKGAQRQVVFGTSDRFDEFTDRIRMVRNHQFLYVKNYHPELPKYKDLSYRYAMPMMQAILTLHKEKLLNPDQNYWFEDKVREELYDCQKDPYQLHNIIGDVKYADVLNTLRNEVKRQYEDKFDYGSLNESEIIAKMWPQGIQPETEKVVIRLKKNSASLTCPTKGASISYLIVPENASEKITNNSPWKLYTGPLTIPSKHTLICKAIRIGYKESQRSELTIN